MSVKTTNKLSAAEDESAIRSLVRAFGLLDRAMNPYFARFGVTSAQWGVLRVLHRAELQGTRGLRLTELSERLLVRPPSITGIVDRMQREGLVVRSQVTDDLRARRVALTRRGRHRLQRILMGHEEQLRRVLRPLNPMERKTLDRLLDRLGSHLQQLDGEPVLAGVE